MMTPERPNLTLVRLGAAIQAATEDILVNAHPYAAANNTTKPKKNRDKVKAARKQNRNRK